MKARASSPGISGLELDQLDCSSFHFNGFSGDGSGYAGVRIWANNTAGTPLVDSYVAGYPSSYTGILSTNWFPNIPNTNVNFAPQPAGTTLVARVYRALNPVPGSWDGQNFVDTTVQCTYGIHMGGGTLTCSSWQFLGYGATNGYAAVRIWLNKRFGTPLVDSYVSGYPSYYTPIKTDGTFQGLVTFTPQQYGTVLYARLYRALSPVPGSWDSGAISDMSWTCGPVNTPTPFP